MVLQKIGLQSGFTNVMKRDTHERTYIGGDVSEINVGR